jgi:hypothetical protein
MSARTPVRQDPRPPPWGPGGRARSRLTSIRAVSLGARPHSVAAGHIVTRTIHERFEEITMNTGDHLKPLQRTLAAVLLAGSAVASTDPRRAPTKDRVGRCLARGDFRGVNKLVISPMAVALPFSGIPPLATRHRRSRRSPGSQRSPSPRCCVAIGLAAIGKHDVPADSDPARHGMTDLTGSDDNDDGLFAEFAAAS